MKGLSMPISLVVILIIAFVVMIVVLLFVYGPGGTAQEAISASQAWQQGCSAMKQNGCQYDCSKYIGSATIKGFKSDVGTVDEACQEALGLSGNACKEACCGDVCS